MEKNINDHCFILASGSPRRKELITSMGIDPVIIPTDADETIPDDITGPEETVKLLSARKAEAALSFIGSDNMFPLISLSGKDMSGMPAIILGSDTIVVKDGMILGKPADKKDAFRMLSLLENDAHYVYTGIHLILTDDRFTVKKTLSDAAVTKVCFSHIPETFLKEYIDSGKPMDKAGSYGIQDPIGRFAEGIDGEYTNVIGLPTDLLRRSLSELIKQT